MKICVWTGARIWKICSSIEQSERRKYRNCGQITISLAALFSILNFRAAAFLRDIFIEPW